MTTSRKTMQLDILQLNSLRFLTSNNNPIPSSLVLSANGDGTTSFVSLSSIEGFNYNTISVPGQHLLNANDTTGVLKFSSMTSELYISTSYTNSVVNFGIPSLTSTIASTINYVLPSTMFNILNYPNLMSSIGYKGNTGKINMSTLANSLVLPNNGDAYFSSFQYNFSCITKYLNPNGSSRMFIDYYPNFTLSPVMEPSSISNILLYPEGNSSIKNLLSLSSHLIYTTANSNIPIIKSGIQQYIQINSSYPYGVSSFINYRILSNNYILPMRFEVDTLTVNSNFNFGLVHYISDGIGSLNVNRGFDVFRSGLDKSTININNNIGDKNSVFVTITNSGNQN